MIFPISACRGTFSYEPASSKIKGHPACSGTRQAYQHTIVSKQECGTCSLEHAKARHALDHKALKLRVQELGFEARVAETFLDDHELVYETELTDDKDELHSPTKDVTTTQFTLAEQERYDSVLAELAVAKDNLAYFEARAPFISFMLERSFPASPIPKTYHRPSICQSRTPGPSSLRFEIEPENISDPKRGRPASKYYNKHDSAIDLHGKSIQTEHIERLEDDGYHLNAGIEDASPSLNCQEECSDNEFVLYDDESEGTKRLVSGWPDDEDWTEAIAEMSGGNENAWVDLPLRAGCSEQVTKTFADTEVVGLGLKL